MSKRRENGFGCLINKGEGKNWLAKWVYEGKTYYKSTGEINRKKAEKVLEKLTRPFREDNKIAVLNNLEAKVKSCKNDIAENNLKLSGLKLCDLENKFNNNLEFTDLTEGTIDLYIGVVDKLIKWLKNDYKNILEMKDVTKEVAEEYLKYLAESVSVSTYNLHLGLLKKLWKVFQKEGRYEDLVFEEFKSRKGGGSIRREMTVEELMKVLEKAKKDEELLCLFGVALYTGLRFSDCCSLKWSEVDMFKKTISVIPIKTRKHMKGPIVIPIHNALFNMLSMRWENKGDDEYVMPKIYDGYKKRTLRIKIYRLFKSCGIKTCELENGKKKYIVGFHSLRHTFVSMNLNSGMNPMLVQNIVGHKSLEMTRHYYHSNEGVVRSSIEKMPDLLGCSDYIDMSVKDSDVELLKSMFDEKKDGSLSDTIKRLVAYYKEYSGIIDVA